MSKDYMDLKDYFSLVSKNTICLLSRDYMDLKDYLGLMSKNTICLFV